MKIRRASIAGHLLSAWLPLGQINALSKIPGLRFARPGAVHHARGQHHNPGRYGSACRCGANTYGFTGSGIKVGILSDSFDTGTGSYATDISTGDLQSGIQVIQDSAGGTDEGRAMAQIVHDVAPGTSIAFATANNGQSGFANNIRALANSGAK